MKKVIYATLALISILVIGVIYAYIFGVNSIRPEDSLEQQMQASVADLKDHLSENKLHSLYTFGYEVQSFATGSDFIFPCGPEFTIATKSFYGVKTGTYLVAAGCSIEKI